MPTGWALSPLGADGDVYGWPFRCMAMCLQKKIPVWGSNVLKLKKFKNSSIDAPPPSNTKIFKYLPPLEVWFGHFGESKKEGPLPIRPTWPTEGVQKVTLANWAMQKKTTDSASKTNKN